MRLSDLARHIYPRARVRRTRPTVGADHPEPITYSRNARLDDRTVHSGRDRAAPNPGDTDLVRIGDPDEVFVIRPSVQLDSPPALSPPGRQRIQVAGDHGMRKHHA
ncbi:hypothetical protein NSK11_contig00007-0060 [Nocardia seriolae]|uniref:Uncharacterized protein n=1 Tax=Nocardia seriolae TaxID=37332 RepID=A0ABC9YNC2_9NOCA|nr:hypothetical protein NSERKGN1266_46550 [Nocardia seriolae]BEK96455.1 hypothetical protein NSER024013_43610 [Nocardia seriolae]GAM44557.1 hypothetical protein NS07_v2contig00005-0060 [Nocardia seriolae]GAP26576.1 hypothetical protein NSK11_contig00007-0060 [Nocardia seriolae]GEM22139.1 hypothetical protein NS2_03780 [Nocardia seriolae NBRC 15557]